MEIGNLVFGNSRGSYKVDRELVNSKEWIRLVHTLLQVEDYHCVIGEYYQDYNSANIDYKKRTNKITPNKFGGFALMDGDDVIFEIFPYWWGECTCGVEDENDKLYEIRKNEIFSKNEWAIYTKMKDWCNDECPASFINADNIDKSLEELAPICTCGCVNKNLKLKKRKESIKDKIKEFERRENEEYIPHKNDCCLVKPNFVYHPNQLDCFSIQWYKYPFRDSYSNKDLSNNEICAIFEECSNLLQDYIKKIGGVY